MTVHDREGEVVLSVGEESRRLTPATAAALRTALGDAVADRRDFVHTVGERRPDGSYVVHRRGADSAGNSVVFDSFAALRRLYERLPAHADAAAVGEAADVTGSRRHLLVRHFAEHPAFPCHLTSRSPLRVTAEDGRPAAED